MLPVSFPLVASFCFFLLVFLFVGALASRRNKANEKDYLLGGGGFGRWMVGLSTGASGNSGFILVAAVGLGYTQGLAAFLYVFGFFVGEYFFWSYIAGGIAARTEEYQSNSVPELLARKKRGGYSPQLRSFTALLTVLFIGVYLVAQLVASAKILESLFSLPLPVGSGITTLLILAYCTTGGLRASVWTDIVQAVLIVFLTLGVCALALFQLGGVDVAFHTLARTNPELLQISPFSEINKTVVYFIGCVFLGFGFSLSSPHLTVRLMAGRNPEEVRRAKWVYFGFLYSTWGAMTVFGILCSLLLPELADPEQALPEFIVANFSPLIIGVLLAAMFSTIASTADSQLLACSSAFSRDIFPQLGERLTRRFGVYWFYAATLLVGVVAYLAAIADLASVFELVIFSGAVLTSTLGMAMLIRVSPLPHRANLLIASMCIGLTTALVWRGAGYHLVLSDAAPGLCSALVSYFFLLRLASPESEKGADPSRTGSPAR